MKISCWLIPLMVAGLAAAATNANDLFEQALMKERSQGDWKGAIAIYQRILKEFPADRKVAAKALSQIGHCQEREGGEQAKRTYQRLIKEFADQPEVVADARARIAALDIVPSSTSPRLRQLWAGGDADSGGSISPDGRWLSFPYWETGDLGRRDLVNGTNKLLTNTGGLAPGGSGDFAQDSRFSPDGKLIAYSWFMRQREGRNGGYELRLMNADGTNVRTLGWENMPGYVIPIAWSQDGTKLLANSYDTNGLNSLHLVSVPSGEHRELMPAGKFGYNSASFSPDGKWIVLDGKTDSQGSDLFLLSASGGRPETLASHPANDTYPVWSKDGNWIYFLSDRGGSNGLWRLPVDGTKPAGPAQLVHGDLPAGATPMGVTDTGAFAFGISSMSRNVYAAGLDPVSWRTTSKAVLISDRRPGNNAAPTVSRDGSRLAYVMINPARGGAIAIRDLTNGAETEIPISMGQADLTWAPDGKRLLAEGYTGPNERELYWVDIAAGRLTAFQSIHPTRNPLSPNISRDGKTVYILHREWPAMDVAVVAIDVKSGQRRTIYKAVGLAWIRLSPDGSFLAVGRRIDVFKPEIELLALPVSGGEPRSISSATFKTFPAQSPFAFTPDGKFILISRAKDPKRSEVVRLEIATGKIEATGLEGTAIAHAEIDASGKKIFFADGVGLREIWIAENILPVK
jgi:Tol biopolymer transport system component